MHLSEISLKRAMTHEASILSFSAISAFNSLIFCKTLTFVNSLEAIEVAVASEYPERIAA
jgi:hypothetical protein